MARTLHERFSGPFVKIILGVIGVVFGGFFGIQGYFGNSRSATFVAMVDGHEISQQQFRERYDATRAQMQRMYAQYNQPFDAAAYDTPERKREILDQLINEQLMLAANEKLGTAVTPAAIRNEITSYPAFQTDGKFDANQYRMLLNAQRRSVAQFEEEVRRDLDLRLMTMQLSAGSFVSDADVNAYLRLRDQMRDFRYAKLDKPSAANIKIADADVEEYYKAHGDAYLTPERVSLQYVEIDAARILPGSSVDDATLEKQYQEQKSHFVTQEQRLASHILVKVEKNADATAQKAALSKAEGIAKEAKSGKDFAALAKADSDDSGSKALGGDLGWLEKGVTDPAFETALFALKKGDISDPVKSDEGYHIIQLRDVHAEKVRSFEDVKAELTKKYLDAERERQYTDVSGKLTDAIIQDPAALVSAAKSLGLSMQKTALFGRTGGEGIAASPAVIKAAFSAPVLAEGNASDPIELGPNHIVIVRADEHEKPEPRPLDQVRDDIRRKLLDEQVAKAAHERAETLYARLDKGESLDKIAGETGVKVQEEKDIGRNAANVDRKLVDAVFALNRPQNDKPVTGQVELGSDAYALIELAAVKDGDPSKLDAKTREAARNQLRQGVGTEAVRGYIDSLRKAAKIEIAEDRLQ